MGCDPVPASEATVVDAPMLTQPGRAGAGQGELCDRAAGSAGMHA